MAKLCLCITGYENCAWGNIKKFTRKCVQQIIWKFEILVKSLDTKIGISNSGNCGTRRNRSCVWNTRPWGPTPVHSWWKNWVCCWPNWKIFNHTRIGVWKTRAWRAQAQVKWCYGIYKWGASGWKRRSTGCVTKRSGNWENGYGLVHQHRWRRNQFWTWKIWSEQIRGEFSAPPIPIRMFKQRLPLIHHWSDIKYIEIIPSTKNTR